MSTKNIHSNIRNSYCKNNRIRSKLLLFIDNEIQTKIKQNTQNIFFKCEDETQIGITFEETFTHKQINKFDLSSSNIPMLKKFDNSDKSFSTVDDSPNKMSKNSNQKKRNNIHYKTFSNENKCSNKSSNNIINFNKKNYSIKNLIKQSSTFLILPKQKNATEYLKNLCNNLKICKIHKNPAKHNASIIFKSKLFNLNRDDKSPKKLSQIKLKKSKKDNKYSYSLFRKSKKKNSVLNSKNNIYANSILIEIKQKE